MLHTISPEQFREDALAIDTWQIDLGFMWLLQAIAHLEIQQNGLNEKQLWEEGIFDRLWQKYLPILEEAFPQLFAAIELEAQMFGVRIFSPDGIYIQFTPAQEVREGVKTKFHAWFPDMAREAMLAPESLAGVQIIMVVGHQGSGKGAITDVLKQRGYEVLSMSQIVREVAEMWGFSSKVTVDKIITGQLFKEKFGQAVLLYLALQHAIAGGHTKIVIDGPRVMAEVDAALQLGARLIGVTSGSDPQKDQEIRRKRIERRAASQPERKGDVTAFDDREEQEFGRIEAMLKKVDPEQMVMNNEGIGLDVLQREVEKVISQFEENHQ